MVAPPPRGLARACGTLVPKLRLETPRLKLRFALCDAKEMKSYDRRYWPGGVIVLVSEWIVIGVMIWIFGWPK